MKQVQKEIEEINRLYDLSRKTESSLLRRDSKKAIVRKIQDLKEYCSYRNLNFEELSKSLKVRCDGDYIHLRY